MTLKRQRKQARWIGILLAAVCLHCRATYAEQVQPATPDEDDEQIVQSELAFLLQAQDIRQPAELLTRLREARDPFSRYLRDNCAPTTRRSLGAYGDPSVPPDPALVQAVVNDLNRLMRGESLYERDRFEKVELRRSTSNFMRRNPQGAALVQLNRHLLEDAYPDELTQLATQPLDVKADSLDFESEDDIMIASGNVVVTKDDETLRSDYAIINLRSHDVVADGRVSFERGNDVWVGERLNYNFKTQRGDFGAFKAYLEPFYVNARSSQRSDGEEFLLKDVRFTTCEGDQPAVYMHASTARVIPNHSIRAYNVVMYAGGVPILYTPFWFQNVGTRNFISITPGYNSRMGLFLLTAFNYRLSRHLEASTHVDPRTRRGVGVGQNIMWSSSGNARGLSTERFETDDDDGFTDIWMLGRRARRLEDMEKYADTWYGDLITYYMNDSWPEEGKTQEYPIESDRYRLRLYHNHSITEKDYLMLQANYLSDPKIIQQFFREEYKTYPEPENFLVLGRRTQEYALNLQVQKRLNDFYTTVDRVPEINFDVTRQEIASSRFYYESETSGGYLQKLWEENATNRQDYSSLRFHTDHSVNYPAKFFGFLNVIPRTGYRGTYYSRTKEDYDVVTEETEIDTNGVVNVTSTTNTFMRQLDAEFRNVYEIGVESSFKAFKIWETHPGEFINNLRHIAEPYADYTYIPEPNVRPDNLYQFDKIDEIDRRNDVKIGLRNKLQTKRRQIYDLINADIWTSYRLDPELDQNQFSNIGFDLRSEPLDWMRARIDGSYDQYESELATLNSRLTFEERTFWSCSLEHRYRKDRNSLLRADVRLNPYINWGYRVFTRYDFEDGELEAYGASIRRVIDCVAVEIGYEHQDDDYEIWLQFWFTEFPKGRVNVGL